MKKYLQALLLLIGILLVSKMTPAEATVLPADPITNVRMETNLKDHADVKLTRLNLLNSRIYTIVDDDKNLYFCMDESKYYPSGNEYSLDLDEKISGSVLWLLETFYANQNQQNVVENVAGYRDANELTRYAAVQIAIWKFTGGDIPNEIMTANPLVKDLYNEAKTKAWDDISYHEMIDKLKNVEINAVEVKPDGDDGANYNYKLQFEDNLDQETEKLFKINDEETQVSVQLYKHGQMTTITKDVTIEKNYQDRTIVINVPKELIDNDKAEDAAIYFNIDTLLTTRQPYYLVFVSKGVQPIGGYKPIEHILTARASIDLNSAETSFSVLKHWNDKDNQDGKRPVKLPVQLYQSDQPYKYTGNESTTAGTETKFGDQVLLSDENDWEYIWGNLPITNDSGNKVYYTAKEEFTSDYTLTIHATDEGKALLLVNSYEPAKTELQGIKKWNDANNQDGKRPTAISINLLADGEMVQTKMVTKDSNWTYKFLDLPKYNNGKEITYTVTEEAVPEYSTSIDGTIVTNTHEPEETEIAGTKIWDDQDNQDGKRPNSITVNLLANGEVVGSKEVSAKEQWTYSFTKLPKYQEGQEIIYTVTENTVPEYSAQIEGTQITNQYTPGKTSVTVTKAWKDHNNQDGLRPNSIKVQLYADGQALGEPVILNEGNQWTATWDELAEKAAGKTIQYTVKELDIPTDYETSVIDDNQGNILIANTHDPEETEITGTKIWDDQDNQDGKRPNSITVNLLANGEVVESKEVSAKEQWTYSFTKLPKYQEGQEIMYTVTENTVPEYSTQIEGTQITNQYTPGKTSVTVTKAWKDHNNQDGLRPNSIKVQLYANDQALGEPVTLNEDNQWTTTWAELAEKAAGKTIQYVVKEVEVPDGYETSVNDDNHGNILITNIHEPEETEVAGTKVWDDQNNQDGKRPNSVTVNLLANGKVVESKEVSAKEQWTYRFTKLPKYQEGQEIRYTVTENTVPEYSTQIEGTKITNRYTPGQTSVTVTKAWKDHNNQDGLRPNSIKVQLYANGQAVGKSVTLNEDNQWTTTWAELAEKTTGKTIQYTVKEVEVPAGYEATINEDNQGNIVLTNTHNLNDPAVKKDSDHQGTYPTTGEKQNKFLVFVGIFMISMLALIELNKVINGYKQ